jgi:ribosomal protein S18 acetylase RimI-like enzyme
MNPLSPDGIVEEFLDRWRNSDLPAKMPEPMLVANGPVVELTLITVYELHQRQGHASRALQMLAALCDENGVFISLVARPMGGPEFSLAPCGPASLSTDELVAWYTRHGFVETGVPGDDTRTMLRKPRTIGATT